MLDFFRDQKQRIETEIKELYLMRSRAGVGTAGDITNRIEMLEREFSDITRKIKTLETQEAIPEAPSAKPASPLTQIEAFIVEGNIEAALKVAATTLSNKNDIILLQGRFASVNQHFFNGILDFEEYRRELARITVALQSFIK